VTPEQVKYAYWTMLQNMRAYLREMNVSERLADDMLATEPEKVRILTQAELTRYGLANVEPAEQQRRAIDDEVRDVREANQLGSIAASTSAERLSQTKFAVRPRRANR
jgi:C4-dicarboxylate-specific signal transduction histidine kinase